MGCVVCQKFLGRPSLSRRDVKITSLCHVTTWSSHVSTSFLTPLCHVATWMYTSRRQLVQAPVTSRRGFTRRDVVWLCALSHRDVTPNVATWSSEALCHVATSPRTSRRGPVFSPRTVHFGPSSHTPSLIGTLALLRSIAHRTRRSSHPTGRRPSISHRPSEFSFEPTSAPGTEPLW